MKKLLLDVSLLLISLVAAYIFSFAITGFVSGGVDVSIKESIDGEITAFTYESSLVLGQNQSIVVEFTNTGTSTYEVMIEENIYYYDNGKLNLTQEFYDASAPLSPGMKKGFKTYYLPTVLGVYYIQAKVYYGSRTTRTWGSFSVFRSVTYQPSPPPSVIYSPPEIVEERISELSLDYPKSVAISQNQSQIINITAKNTGETNLYELRLSVSVADRIEIDIEPKKISPLLINESAMFLLLVHVPANITAGQYPLDFEVVSDKKKETGKILLNISSMMLGREDIYNKILNYEFLILKTEADILSASLKGFDVDLAKNSLDSAKLNLRKARDYYYLEKYDDARAKLTDVEKDLMDAVFQLYHAMLVLYVVQVPMFTFAILVALAAIVILSYLWLRRRKEKRPKLLQEAAET
jgi:hypothetical protein